MNNDKKRFFLIIMILALIIMIIGASYAYFLLLISKEEDSTELYTGTLDVEYSQSNIIYGSLFYPREDPESLDDTDRVYVNTFNITNTGTLDGYMRIGLFVTENEFPDNALSYNIYNSDGDLFMSGFISSEDSFTLADNIFMKSGESTSYTVQIWLGENGRQQNKSNGKRLTAAIEVTAKQIIE